MPESPRLREGVEIEPSDGSSSTGNLLEYWPEPQVRQLLERLPAGAYLCDRQGLITYFNERAEALWGRKPRLGDPIDRFCGSFRLFYSDGSPMDHSRCWMARALDEESEFLGEEVIIERPDGERLTALAYANPIRDERGRLTGAVNVLVDITDRKEIERSLHDADRSKNEFLATLAHELRNPLAPVRNAVQILHLEGPATPELRWALEVIDRQMSQMTRLIDDLMDVARITRDRLELRMQPTDLAEVVNAAVEVSRPLLDAQGHELRIDLPSSRVSVLGDPTRLGQVFANLLNNAAKYTPAGGKVELTASFAEGEVVVRVRDDGIGLPSDMLAPIFDMFEQVRGSENGSEGGLGIGLTLVRRLVELHGGSVEASSDGPSRGSVFTVRLPARADVDSRKPAAEEPEVAPSSSQRILVVDDNRDATTSLAMLLELTGAEVRTANDGFEALEVAEELEPDVVLLDIGMPRMDGYQVARRLRERSWGENATLIAITGWGQEEDRRRSKAAGFDHHLVKPVNPPELLALLAKLDG